MQKDYFDYNKYDHLSVALNSAIVAEAVKGYKSMGWELAERKADKRYSNVEHFEFYRLHNVENKDRLQLLQVYMESTINSLSQSMHSRHSASITVGIVSSIFCTLSIVGGLLLFSLVQNLIALIGGIIILAVGIIGIVAIVVYLKYLAKKENERADKLILYGRNKIRQIHAEASMLTGVKDE